MAAFTLIYQNMGKDRQDMQYVNVIPSYRRVSVPHLVLILLTRWILGPLRNEQFALSPESYSLEIAHKSLSCG